MSTTTFPRNPFLVHRIQDTLFKTQLTDITALTSLSMAIVAYRLTAIDPLIKIIYEEAKKDRVGVLKLISHDCLMWIQEYVQGGTEDDIPGDLFQSPGLCRDTEGSIGIGC